MCDRGAWLLRPRPQVSGYFSIANFFLPDRAPVHTHPVNSTANPEIFKSAPQSGKKIYLNESDNVWTGESGYCRIRWRSNSCPVSYWTIIHYGSTTATTEHIFCHYRALNGACYGACSEHISLQRSPGYLSESGYLSDACGQVNSIWYATCGRENFWKRKLKKKLRIQKYRDMCEWGLKGNHVKFARFVLFAVSQDANTWRDSSGVDSYGT